MKKYLLNTAMVTLSLSLILPTFSTMAADEIQIWRHRNSDNETNAFIASVDRFNASQKAYKITYQLVPEGTYTTSITSAGLAKNLPCGFMVDQPMVPNFAWAGYIRELTGLVDQKILDDLATGAKGTYNGKIYSMGQWDVAVAMFGRRSVLESAGLRVATIDKPYTMEEFNHVLKTLKETGKFKYPADFNTYWKGEWWSYAFGPWLASFGGDEINRDGYNTADNVLNGDAALKFGKWFQSVFTNGYVDKSPADDKAFARGESALNVSGSWAVAEYLKLFGDDLVIMPVPDFGHGVKIGASSWHWAVSTSCPKPQGVAAFLNFIHSPEEIAKMSDAASLIPTREAAAELTEDYKKTGKLRILYEFMKNYGMLRPETPAYPVITSAFEKATRDIAFGADPADALDNATDIINQDLKDNNFYSMKKR